jgi:hypothetical protein
MDMTNPVMIFTMEKVGSTTVMRAIQSAGRPAHRGYRTNIVRLLGLTDKKISIIQEGEKRGRPKDEIRDRVDALICGNLVKWKVITMARDPIARNLSHYWEGQRAIEEAGGDVPYTLEDFLANYGQWVPEWWFDRVVGNQVGIDVYATPFDRKNGWKIYEDRLLVIRTEDLTEKLAEALAAFLGGSPLDYTVTHRANGRERHGIEYEEFVAKAKFNEEFLDRMYNTQYANHFYYKREIKKFRKRWSE